MVDPTVYYSYYPIEFIQSRVMPIGTPTWGTHPIGSQPGIIITHPGGIPPRPPILGYPGMIVTPGIYSTGRHFCVCIPHSCCCGPLGEPCKPCGGPFLC
ncbi:hypothetical protein [Bacillus paramycoides]|uniref:hypothetical protein n=1 Tax=Bacillus paramycoides TaxID=2026194 RepID=UPI002E1F1443|nr:hypothetical protein [Bacillus paramycoides]